MKELYGNDITSIEKSESNAKKVIEKLEKENSDLAEDNASLAAENCELLVEKSVE